MTTPKRRCRWCGRPLFDSHQTGRGERYETAHCASPTCTWGDVCAREILRARQEDAK